MSHDESHTTSQVASRATSRVASQATSRVLAKLSGVSLVYNSDGQTTRALDEISLTLAQGEWLCVLGANGSGKSTLAQVIAGLLAPDEGDVELLGVAVCTGGTPNFEAYRHARRNIGIVFQNPDDQIVTSVVEEDVAFGPENLGLDPEEIRVRVDRELTRVAMSEYALADPARLSGGQRQRVTIASALAMEPKVLVLDEPTSLLDVRGRRALARAIGRLRASGTSIVHVTHDMEDALLADRVIVLDHGHIALEGSPNEIFSHANELMRLNLEQPFAARLQERLAQGGLELPWTLNADQLAEEVRKCLPTEGASQATDPLPQQNGNAHSEEAAPTAQQECDKRNVLLKVDDLSFAYSNSSATREFALKNISFTLHEGELLAVVGQTGSGKSTLARLICALDSPDSGTIHILGLNTASKRELPQIRGRIGYVMQHPERQLFAQSVAEDVAYGPKNLGLPAEEVAKRVTEVLELVGLENKANASPFSLSGGQRRLCAIAGVLAMGPQILVLDEPMAGLDPRGRQELSQLITALKDAGTSIVEITHSMEEAALADRIAFINEGKLEALCAPRELFRNRELLEAQGLGVPEALEFAQACSDPSGSSYSPGSPASGSPDSLSSPDFPATSSPGSPILGEPLTLEELAENILNRAMVSSWR